MDRTNDIIKKINSISGSKSPYNVFTDWIKCTAIAIMQSVWFSADREQIYLNTIKDYNGRGFSDMCAWLSETIEYKMTDVLGNLFMQSGWGNKNTGQFFTPYNVSLMTAKMTITDIPEDEGIVIMETLKKFFGGKLGANLLEYPFPSAAYNEDGAQHQLYETVRDRLENDTACGDLIKRIASNMEYPSAYTILIGFCTYSIPTGSEADSDQYNFIAAAICPAESDDNGLMFDNANRTITKKATADMLISQAPTDGFFFPVFNYRRPDVNSVMYYTKAPKRPNLSVIEDVLCCKFIMTCQHEKEAFQQILTEVAGEELSYSVITQVNEFLYDLALQAKDDPEPPKLDKESFLEILGNAGVSAEKLEAFPACFKDKVESSHTEKLTISNIAESKISLSNSYVSVSVDRSDIGKVHTSVQNGRRCLVIDLDEPSLLVNGMPVTL